MNEGPDLLLEAESTGKSAKRKREVQCPELASALLEWFLQYEKDGPMSGEMLRDKERVIYGLMYPMDEVPLLKFSNGWLNGFKVTHTIQEYKPHGESGKI